MPAKNLSRKNEEGIYSHIFNKGVEQRFIFNDPKDYEVFQGFLKDYLTTPQDPESIKQSFTVHGRVFQGTPHQPKNYFNKVELIAYSLMPDHFHLLLYQKTSGSIESFIRSLCTRYSIYFNKKYQRTGALFEGPYKSIQIKDGTLLVHLTRYLHHTGTHSSYPEYLATRISSWVNPNVVLSFFDQATNSYKNFVEKYQPTQKEKELLSRIIFESETAHLERNLARNMEKQLPEISSQPFKKSELNSNLKPHQRIPEFLAITVLFLLLLTLGIRNIMASTNHSTPFILGIKTNIAPPPFLPNSSPIPSLIPNPDQEVATTSAEDVSTIPADAVSETPADAVEPKMLTVKIDDGAATVNIRQNPTINSKRITKARNGDTFEYLSIQSEWYEIKLADGSIGYIASQYVNLGGDN